jgi:hypothetical protein
MALIFPDGRYTTNTYPQGYGPTQGLYPGPSTKKPVPPAVGPSKKGVVPKKPISKAGAGQGKNPNRPDAPRNPISKRPDDKIVTGKAGKKVGAPVPKKSVARPEAGPAKGLNKAKKVAGKPGFKGPKAAGKPVPKAPGKGLKKG